MSSIKTIWQIAVREMNERGRSATYLLTSAAVLLGVVGLAVFPSVFFGGDETTVYTVGALGRANQEIVETSEVVANATDEDDAPPSVRIETVDFQSRGVAELALMAGEIDALLVDGAEIVQDRAGGFWDQSAGGVIAVLQRGASTLLVEQLVEADPETSTAVIEALSTEALETTYLTGDDESTEFDGLVAYVGLILLMTAILLYGTWILTGISEEKSNRVVEVILSTVRPWQLLTGKVLGIGILGLGQFALTVAAGLIAVRAVGAVEIPSFGLATGMTFVVWFLLGFVLYAIMFAAAGALAGRPEDAQSLSAPLSLTAVAGFMVSIFSLTDPESTLAVIGTLVPFTAPFMVPVRASLGAITVWEYGLSVAITLATIGVLTMLAGRIYAGGLLHFGSRTKLTDAWSASRD